MISGPKISIITPCYNGERFIGECIQSVLNQSYDNWEHIIVDDYSSDNSREIIKNFVKLDSRIKPIFLKNNNGSGVARNIAIRSAQGDYIAFLDSDDLWHPEKLEKHISFMRKTQAVLSHTSYGFISEHGDKIKSIYNSGVEEITYKKLLRYNSIGCLTAIYNAKKIGKYYMPLTRVKQDYGLWLSITKDGYNSIPLNQELSYYRQVKGSATSNKIKLITKHYYFLKDEVGLNSLQSVIYTLTYLINGFFKYFL